MSRRARGRSRLRAALRALALPVLVCALVTAAYSTTTPGTSAAYSAATSAAGNTLGARACYPRQPADNPVFLYSYNEDSGSTAEDSSGNGNDGTLQGTAIRTTATCSTTRAGGYLHLDGDSADGGGNASMVTTPLNLTSATTLSVEAWFRTTSAVRQTIIGFGSERNADKSATHDRVLYLATGGQLRFGVYSGGVEQVGSSTTYNDGAWHHAVGVFSPSVGVQLYVDGALVASNASYTSAYSYSGWWRIGQEVLWGWDGYDVRGEPFVGDLDDTAVYSTALSATQVSDHFAAGR